MTEPSSDCIPKLHSRRARRAPRAALLGAVLSPLLASLLATGCRDGMANQPKLRPYRRSAFYEDGASARPLVPGTVPRGFLREDRVFYTGMGADGKFVAELPVNLGLQPGGLRGLLERGRERFDIFCSPCHGRTGAGQGMVVQRGFKRPSSFHVERLQNERLGYFFDVMTNGFGEMSSYASQVPPEDRWAIAAYIRTLQFSQIAPAALLTESDLEQLEAVAGAGALPPPKGR